MRTTFSVATRPGWNKEKFIRPDGSSVLAGRRPIVRLPDDHGRIADKFHDAGDPVAWAKIVQLASGNSRLMAAICLATCGPIVDLCQLDPPAIQLVDPRSGVGKSAILASSASFWGGRINGNFLDSWNQTPGHLELLARLHNGSLLVLDDLRTFNFKARGFEGFDEALMCLANGRGKGRLTDVGPLAVWRTPVLSSANASIDETAAMHGRRADDALRLRLVDVPLPAGGHGAFEVLHGFDGHGALGAELYRLARLARGCASLRFIAFLERVVARGKDALCGYVDDMRSAYITEAGSHFRVADRDLTRLHDRFATVYASALLAIRADVLPWTAHEVFEALIACTRAHIDLVAREGGGLATYESMPIERLKAYVSEHRSSFVRYGAGMADSEHEHDSCPGYVGSFESRPEYFFSDQVFQDICGGRSRANQVKGELDGLGMLHRLEAGYSTRRSIRRNGRLKREQGVAVRVAFFEPQQEEATSSKGQVLN